MISTDFESLMKKTFRDSLKVAVNDSLSREDALTFRENISADAVTAEHAIVLTISSHIFRVLIVMYYSLDDVFSRYLKACLGESSAVDESKIQDFLFEVGNLYCGTMKRDLQKAVPSLGMSTPNLLKSEALAHVNVLKLDMEHHVELKYDGDTLMFASFFLSAYGDVEVAVTTETEDVDAGELEFF